MVRLPTAPALEADFRPQFRTVHGYRRAFRMGGRPGAPCLLLLHGIGDNSATWLPVLPALARDYFCIAPDLLGHGHSDKPRADYSIGGFANGIRDLLSVLDVDRVTLVGHSLGGGVAMQFAYQYPERVDRLVLVGTGGVGRRVHPALRLAAAPGADLALPLATSAPARAAVNRVARALDSPWGRRIDADLVHTSSVYDGLSTRTARQAFLRTLRSVVDVRGQVVTMLDRCYLARGLPTLIVWGRRDSLIPVRHASRAHEAMPGSELEIFDESGHFPHRDEPERFVTLLDRFVRQTQRSTFDIAQWRKLLRDGPAPVSPALREDVASPAPEASSGT